METMPIFRTFENVSEGVDFNQKASMQTLFCHQQCIWAASPGLINTFLQKPQRSPFIFLPLLVQQPSWFILLLLAVKPQSTPALSFRGGFAIKCTICFLWMPSQNIDCRVQMRLHQQYQWPVLFTHGRAFSFFGVRNFLPRNFSRDTNGIKYTILILTLVMMDDVAAQSITRFLLCKINCWFYRNQGCIGQTGRAPAQGMS